MDWGRQLTPQGARAMDANLSNKYFEFEFEIDLILPHCLSFVVSVAQNGESRRFGKFRGDAWV